MERLKLFGEVFIWRWRENMDCWDLLEKDGGGGREEELAMEMEFIIY